VSQSELRGQRVCVTGLGVSGIAAATLLLDVGASVLVVDGRDDDATRAAAAQIAARGAEVRLGDSESPVDVDLVVTSPGWRPAQPLLVAAREQGLDVIGEPELAWRLRPTGQSWLGVTGTNGKTTTVGMLAAVLAAAGRRSIAAGNVGEPLSRVVMAQPAYDVLAVEMSSFQLHWSESITFLAAAILNVAEDHLDWHGSMAAYRADKSKILEGARYAVINRDDPQLGALSLPPRVIGFTLSDPEPGDWGLRDGLLVDATGDVVMAAGDLATSGPHNIANALAAGALAGAYGVRVDTIAAGLSAYRGGTHRNVVVDTIDNVAYVDDSKATNPHAASASLSAYEHVVWIAGGLLKGASVEDVVIEQRNRLRAVVLLGADRARIRDALARHAPDVPVVEVEATDTGAMTAVVTAASHFAVPGDTVLLAPAAASMDMFANYAERGEAFAAAVRGLAEGRG
jgi:UDP-N-acetylmuramoylalanine--D-glutamate ligase